MPTRAALFGPGFLRAASLVLLVTAAGLVPGVVSAAPAGKPWPPAQETPDDARRAPGRAWSASLQIGASWMGGTSLGVSRATLTPNERNPVQPLTLFRSEGERRAAAGLDVRLGFRLTSSLAVEGGLAYSRPGVQVTIADDYEQAPRVTFAGNRLAQYQIEAAVVWHLRRDPASGRRVAPFLQAGGGYLRQVHDGNASIETGEVYFGGGGVQVALGTRPQGLLTGLALRADARLCYQRRGFSFDGEPQVFPVVGAGLVFAF